MFLKTPFKILTLTLCSCLLNAQETLTLESVFEKVQANNRAIRIQQKQEEIALESVENARNAKLPDLRIEASADQASNFLIFDNGLFQTASKHDVIHSLFATQTNLYFNLYEGLRAQNTQKLQQLQLKLKQEQTRQTAGAQKLLAAQFYLDLYLQEQWENLIRHDVEDKEHQLKEIRDFHELGTILESDVLRAQLELSKRQMTLIEIQNQKKKIVQELNILMGYNDQTIWKLADIPKDIPKLQSYDQVLQTAQHLAYSEAISHLEVQLSQTQLALVKAQDTPKIGIGGSLNFSNPQIFLYPYNDSWYTLGTVGLKLSYSLDQLYKNHHKKQLAKLEIEEKHEHHRWVEDALRTQVYTAYLSFEESVQRHDIYRLNEEFAKENARILKDAYFNQTALITDLLDADILYLKSKFELQQSLVTIFKNYYQLLYRQGAL